MNLRGLYPSNLRKAAETMGQGVKGSAMRTFSRIMDVAFGPAAVQERPPKRPDPQAYELKTLQAKLAATPTDQMQGLLDKMAAGVLSGEQPDSERDDHQPHHRHCRNPIQRDAHGER